VPAKVYSKFVEPTRDGPEIWTIAPVVYSQTCNTDLNKLIVTAWKHRSELLHMPETFWNWTSKFLLILWIVDSLADVSVVSVELLRRVLESPGSNLPWNRLTIRFFVLFQSPSELIQVWYLNSHDRFLPHPNSPFTPFYHSKLCINYAVEGTALNSQRINQ
jgi:hypothetical protein